MAGLFQCTDHDDTNQTCIEESTPATGVSRSCSDNPYPWYFCEVQDGGSFWLEESSKAFMPFYCREIGSTLRYKNNLNDELNFTLRSKVANISPSIYNTNKMCPLDHSKFIATCFKSDYVLIRLESQTGDIRFAIILSTMPELKDGAHVGIGDFLEISRMRDSTLYFVELEIVVEQRSLTYSKTYNQEFHDVLEIDGKLYRNIFTVDNSFILPKKYTYYYNKSNGLVAFRDDKEVVWHLQD